MTSVKPSYLYAAKLVRVIDGDTVVLDVDLGWKIYVTMHVRLAGLNAPEINTQEGKDAKTVVTDWLTGNLVLEGNGIDKYGRALGVIYSDAQTTSLNEMLLTTGKAAVYK